MSVYWYSRVDELLPAAGIVAICVKLVPFNDRSSLNSLLFCSLAVAHFNKLFFSLLVPLKYNHDTGTGFPIEVQVVAPVLSVSALPVISVASTKKQ